MRYREGAAAIHSENMHARTTTEHGRLFFVCNAPLLFLTTDRHPNRMKLPQPLRAYDFQPHKRAVTFSRACCGIQTTLPPPPMSHCLHYLLSCQASMTPSRGPQAPWAAPTRACQSLLVLALTMGAARGFLSAPAAGGDLRRAAGQGSSHRTGRIATSVRAAGCYVDVGSLDLSGRCVAKLIARCCSFWYVCIDNIG